MSSSSQRPRLLDALTLLFFATIATLLPRAEADREEAWAVTIDEVDAIEEGLTVWNEDFVEGDTLAEILASSAVGGDDDPELDAYESLDGFLAFNGVAEENVQKMSEKETQAWMDKWEAYRQKWGSREMQMKLDMARKKKLLDNTDRMVCKRADDLDLVVPFVTSKSDTIDDPSAPVIRVVSGRAGDTGYDIYLTVDSVWVPKLDMTVKLTRINDGQFEVGDHVYATVAGSVVKALILDASRTTFEVGYENEAGEQATALVSTADMKHLGKAFELEVFGQEQIGKAEHQQNMATISFMLDGLTPLAKSWLVSKGISMFTNKENGKAKQKGTVHFKLSARGIGIVDPDTGLWRVNLVKKNMKGLSISLSNQAIINRILSFYGSDIEKVAADTIWKQLETAVPKSFAALTAETHAEDMHIEFAARVTGQQTSAADPLLVNFNLNTKLDMNIPKILDTLINTFEVHKLAEQYFAALVKNQDLKGLWAANQDKVRAILARYGVVLDDLELGEWNEDMIKEKLLQAASRSEDFLMAGLEPFMKAQNPDAPGVDPFEGVRAYLNLKGGWGAPDHLADFSVKGKTSSTGEMLHIPRNFFTVVTSAMTDKYNDLVAMPPDGEKPASMTFKGLAITAEGVSLEWCDLSEFRVKTKSNVTTSLEKTPLPPTDSPIVPKHTQVWKLSSNMKDFKMVFPPSMAEKVSATLDWPGATVLLSDKGDVTMAFGAEGFKFKERELPPKEVQEVGEVNLKSRRGSETRIDGPLPKSMTRPLIKLPKTDKRAMMPKVGMELGISTVSQKMTDKVSHLVTEVTGSITTTVNLNSIIRPVAANRPTLDEGYAFAAGKFQLYFYDWSKYKPQESSRTGSTYYVLVNCGYVRLINSRSFAATDPTTLSKFNNFGTSEGQWEVGVEYWMDTTKEIPEIGSEMTPDGQMTCLKLPPRPYTWVKMSYTEWPMICATNLRAKEHLQKVQQAIKQQVLRFRNQPERTAQMKFGTHDRYDRFRSPKAQYKLPAGLGTKPLREIFTEL
mmetsp:Transcript_56083/g.119399  ORF Transcript_56083/g.119399 Transcript_56083/m.119399 type:complete len:1019 (-) Transcript_56083:222-3278(-)